MLPWPHMLRAALAAGITPGAFWRLSVCEWSALAAPRDTLDRGRLRALIDTYPDQQKDPHHG